MAEELKAAAAARKQFDEGIAKALVEEELVRGLVLQLLIAEELGPDGCRHTGFYDTLFKMTARLLGFVPKPNHRFRLWQHCRDMSDAEIAERVLEMLKRWKRHG